MYDINEFIWLNIKLVTNTIKYLINLSNKNHNHKNNMYYINEFIWLNIKLVTNTIKYLINLSNKK